MAMFKRRTKLVSFRLSDEEYEKIQGACIAEGARSISEFARSVLQRTTASNGHHPAGNGNGIEPVAQELIDTMRELTRQLGKLISSIRPPL
jgi:hypothetical protein